MRPKMMFVALVTVGLLLAGATAAAALPWVPHDLRVPPPTPYIPAATAAPALPSIPSAPGAPAVPSPKATPPSLPNAPGLPAAPAPKVTIADGS